MIVRIAHALALISFYCATSNAEALTLPESQSPGGNFVLMATTDGDGGVAAIQLFEFESKTVVAELPMRSKAMARTVSDLTWEFSWAAGGSAVALTVSDSNHSDVAAFVRSTIGEWKGIDVSAVLNDQLGKLGRPRTDFERIENRALDWSETSDESHLFWVQTRLWDKAGQRYTLKEPILINSHGEYVVR